MKVTIDINNLEALDIKAICSNFGIPTTIYKGNPKWTNEPDNKEPMHITVELSDKELLQRLLPHFKQQIAGILNLFD